MKASRTKTPKRKTKSGARGPALRAPSSHPASGPKVKAARRTPATRTPVPPEPHLRETLAYARSLIRDVPDFPKPGIMFKDITPLLADPRAFHIVLDALAERFIGSHVDAVVGVDARGFIFGGALAARLNASFVPARKPGKLPAAVDRVTYQTEYSTAELEMHKDSITEESHVIVVDDLLATGGTAKAAADLVRKQGGYVVAYAFVVELSFLNGRERLLPVKVESVITY
jgi:adenine phosphoribosyltransferase